VEGVYIHFIAKERKGHGIPTTEDDILDEVRTWYNGYRFSKGNTCVYNPFSTPNFMDEKEVQSYWYSTGTPLTSWDLPSTLEDPREVTSSQR